MEWFGILVDGEIIDVIKCSGEPDYYMFNLGSYSSNCDYEVVRVDVEVAA